MQRIRQKDLPAGLYPALLQVEAFVRQSGLDHPLLELIRFRVSQINGCAYCLDMHWKDAVAAGEDPQRLYSISAWRETPFYTAKEQAALELAEQLTDLSGSHGISDELYSRLSEHFSPAELASLAVAITQINTWNRLTRLVKYEPGSYRVREVVS